MNFELLTKQTSTKALAKATMHEKILKGVNTYLLDNKFNFVVTAENLKDVKANNAELNASIGIIKDFGKKIVDLESEDINTFKNNIKQYCNLIETKRQERLNDIETFEKNTRELLERFIVKYLNDELKNLSVREEFAKAQFLDLVIISNLNPSGDSLVSKCRKELDLRVQQCKSKQDKYDMRVMSLENICYKEGLIVPLDVSYIQGIVFLENDEEYSLKLDSLIQNEVKRNEQIKANLEAHAENKAKQAILAQQKKAKEIFDGLFNLMSVEELENKLEFVQDYDVSEFNLCYDVALMLQRDCVKKLTDLIESKQKTFEDTKEVFDAIVPKSDPVQEVRQEVQKSIISDDGTQIYNVKALFQVSAKIGADKTKLCNAIRKLLNSVGASDESIVSLEVL